MRERAVPTSHHIYRNQKNHTHPHTHTPTHTHTHTHPHPPTHTHVAHVKIKLIAASDAELYTHTFSDDVTCGRVLATPSNTMATTRDEAMVTKDDVMS